VIQFLHDPVQIFCTWPRDFRLWDFGGVKSGMADLQSGQRAVFFDFFNDGKGRNDFLEIGKYVEAAELIQMDDGTGVAYDIRNNLLNHCREGPIRRRRE